MHIITSPHIRRACTEDRAALQALVDGVFGFALSSELPHVFSDARIDNHVVAEIEGRLVGVIGLYPHDFRVGNVTFRTAGIGQVATLPEMRGQGVMSALLAEVCRAADTYDFTWLYGDQQRYARYGWTRGGRYHLCETYDKYLPESPRFAEVRPLDLQQDQARILQALAQAPEAQLFAPADIDGFFHGTRARQWRGWVLGEAMILGDHDGGRIILADGNDAELLVLLAYAARAIRELPGDQWKLQIVCDPYPTPLLRVCQQVAWKLSVQQSANFRIGEVAGFLSKACQLAQPVALDVHTPVSLRNVETGDGATFCCADSQCVVSGEAQDDAYRLTTQQLSELCFGLCPLELLLPGLPARSPLRQVLPVAMHLQPMFGL